MPNTGFYTTPYANWKVFFWAITHSQFGTEDCLFAFQTPVCFWRWQRYRRLGFQLPLTIHIPPYLITEYGNKVMGTDCWDEEDISLEESELCES